MVNLVAAATDALQVRQDLPHPVTSWPDLRIPLPDGAWLHARAWLPGDCEGQPLPALVEYAPFRHRDFTAPRDALIHPWFAGHGYVSLRVELRGSGDSGGMPNDEYVAQEQDDAVAALAWIAAQDWCDGNTGMFGMSWGAFSALQVAARRPPSLRAIIPVHGTDDRFADDIHYKGGCLLGAGLSWGVLQTLYSMRPPDPAITPNDWRERWLERVDRCPVVLTQWMTHQHRNAYWRHGSVSEDYASVECPALVVCGWADGYSNAALRMANALGADSRAWIGPWAHTYPHLAQPGPQGGFLQEALSWWNRWLKQDATPAANLPRIRAWLQEAAPPATAYAERAGRWLALDAWPPSSAGLRRWHLQAGKLADRPGDGDISQVTTPLANGIRGPEWLPHGVGPELPPDQNDEDRGSLCFDGTALDRELILCGAPVLTLKIRSDTTGGLLQARLSDLFPDGSVTQISYGLLNLAHRDGLERPRALVPGEWIEVRLPLNDIAQRVPAGHRLRLAISTQAWPLAWPAPRNMTLALDDSACTLEVPTLSAEQVESLGHSASFDAEIPQPAALEWRRPVARERRIERNADSGVITRTYVKDDGAYRILEHGMEVDAYGELIYHCRDEDPLSARAEYHYRIGFARDDWQTGVECDVEIGADLDCFRLQGEYRALQNGQVIRRRPLDAAIKRRFV